MAAIQGARAREALQLLFDRLTTPIGEMVIVADREGNLRAVDWTDHETRMQRILRLHYGARGFALEPALNPNGLTAGIARYFEGDLTAIDGLAVQTGGTLFNEKYGTPCGTFRAARPFRMQNLLGKLDGQRQSGPSVSLMGQIQSELLCLVIVSAEPTAPSPDMAGESTERDGFLNTRASSQPYRTRRRDEA